MGKIIEIVKISTRGQIAIPTKIRRKLQWQNGDYLTVEVQDGKVVLSVLNLRQAEGAEGQVKSYPK